MTRRLALSLLALVGVGALIAALASPLTAGPSLLLIAAACLVALWILLIPKVFS